MLDQGKIKNVMHKSLMMKWTNWITFLLDSPNTLKIHRDKIVLLLCLAYQKTSQKDLSELSKDSRAK